MHYATQPLVQYQKILNGKNCAQSGILEHTVLDQKIEVAAGKLNKELFQLETDKRDLENRLELADAEIDKLHEWKEQVLEEKNELEVP